MKTSRRSISITLTLLVICSVVTAGTVISAIQVSKQQADISAMEQTLDLRVPNEAKVAALESKIVSLEEKRTQFETLVPVRMSPGDFLENVSNMLTDLNMPANNIEIGELKHLDGYTSLQVQIDFRGSTNAVHRFLSSIETLPRMVRVDNLQITKELEIFEDIESIDSKPTPKPNDRLRGSQLNVKMAFSVFARPQHANTKP